MRFYELAFSFLIATNQNLSERIKVNGIIYMHRISDPRVSGTSRKNIKMFHSLCGEASLGNVRIVTTNWGRVSEEEGNHRETNLKQSAFKALLDAGAQMRRHTNTPESALQIMSELISFEPVTMKIQEELRAGKKLVDTAAGMVLAAEMMEMQKKQERELADLKKEMDDAEEDNNRTLRAELEQERKAVEEKMARANADRKRLEATLVMVRVGSAGEQGGSEKFPQLRAEVRLKALQARCEDLMSPERQPAEESSKQSKPKLKATADPSRELDMTARDETVQIQQLMEEMTRAHKMQVMQLQQIERDQVRMRESREAELHLELGLQRLEAEIQAAKRKQDERARASALSKKVVGGLCQALRYAIG